MSKDKNFNMTTKVPSLIVEVDKNPCSEIAISEFKEDKLHWLWQVLVDKGVTAQAEERERLRIERATKEAERLMEERSREEARIAIDIEFTMGRKEFERAFEAEAIKRGLIVKKENKSNPTGRKIDLEL